MQLYIHEYQDETAVVLTESGQVLGVFESFQEARDAYIDYLDSLDNIFCDDVCLSYAA